MAAIDKIYISTIAQYDEFKDWCDKQPLMVDKYGYTEKISNYLYPRPKVDHSYPAIMAPYFIDAYIIRNCPLDYIQEELKVNYGSGYDEIKQGLAHTTPYTECEYTKGKHFSVLKHPSWGKFNTPFKGSWFVEVKVPKGLPFMHYCMGGEKKPDTWDFFDEYVADYKWASSCAYCKTIKSVKSKIPKWGLPVGTVVKATGRYVGEEWTFLVKK